MSDKLVGRRHSSSCLCGCQHVEGIIGRKVIDADTPKLAELGMMYAEFLVPSPVSDTPDRHVVAYSFDEVEYAREFDAGQRVKVQLPNWDGPGCLVYTVERIEGSTALLNCPKVPGLEERTRSFPLHQLVAA